MLNRRQSQAYDRRYKSWRGPRLESTIDETSDSESTNCSLFDESSRRHRQSEDKEIDKYRSNIKRSIKSACHAMTPTPPPTPRASRFPAVTWSQPPSVDYKTRRRAFDFGRPSKIYRDDSEEMCHLRKRSHLLLDELERERQGNSQLRLEVLRLRNQYERLASLVEEMDSLRRGNASLAREIQARKETNTDQFRSKENEESRSRPVHRFRQFQLSSVD